MRILVACEESGIVTEAFINKGFTNVWSCDILPTSGNYPNRHLQQDATPLLKEKWDMIIAFPPCTYFSTIGANWLFRDGKLNEERYSKGLKMKELFMKIYNADCPRIAIENPVSLKIWNLPQHTQEIQPFMFGDPYKKKTRLWLKGLPVLEPTDIVEPIASWISDGSMDKRGVKTICKSKGKRRSKTFPGIARAMAEQWGNESLLREYDEANKYGQMTFDMLMSV